MAKGKGPLALLLASKGDEETGDEDLGGDAKTSAAEDLISAVKSGDASAVASAFQALYDECSGATPEMDDDEEF